MESVEYTYKLAPKELEPIECPHRLCSGLNVLVHDMRLAAHFHGLERHHVQDGAVGGKEEI